MKIFSSRVVKAALYAGVIGAFVFGCTGNGGGVGSNEVVELPDFDGLLRLGNGVSYQPGSVPVGSAELLSDVTMNSVVVSGGSTMITILANEALRVLYISVGGEPGYYVVDLANDFQGIIDGLYRYTPVVYISQTSQTLSDGATLPVFLVGVSAATGEKSTITTSNVRTDVVGSGVLQLALTWNTTSDVDMHVILPNGNRVYFGRKVERDATTYDTLVHLDKDANVGCGTVSNENMYFRRLENGLYLVYLRLYTNCSSQGAVFNLTATAGGRVLGDQYLRKVSGDFTTGKDQVLGVITVQNGRVVTTNYSATDVVTLLNRSLPKQIEKTK